MAKNGLISNFKVSMEAFGHTALDCAIKSSTTSLNGDEKLNWKQIKISIKMGNNIWISNLKASNEASQHHNWTLTINNTIIQFIKISLFHWYHNNPLPIHAQD